MTSLCRHLLRRFQAQGRQYFIVRDCGADESDKYLYGIDPPERQKQGCRHYGNKNVTHRRVGYPLGVFEKSALDVGNRRDDGAINGGVPRKHLFRGSTDLERVGRCLTDQGRTGKKQDKQRQNALKRKTEIVVLHVELIYKRRNRGALNMRRHPNNAGSLLLYSITFSRACSSLCSSNRAFLNRVSNGCVMR